ncbi:MAG: DNA adenine methylase [Lentisphaerota bacterium]
MKSPLNYFGGKSKLAKVIVPMITKDHTCYVEPFCGAAWVFFSKPESEVEVINDMDNELVTFWRVIQNHLEPFLSYFKHAIISRKIWEWEKMKHPETLTDIQRAVRYYYLQRLGFGGKTKGRTFGAAVTKPMNLNLSTIEEVLLNVHWRLKRVTIEHLDALDCIARYDRKNTFFYIDPPYFFNQDDYAVSFSRFSDLVDVLGAIKGRFILSINDCQEIRDLFKKFNQKRVKLTYSSGNSRTSGETRSKPRSELLIHNLSPMRSGT